jgi:hypothetical protein
MSSLLRFQRMRIARFGHEIVRVWIHCARGGDDPCWRIVMRSFVFALVIVGTAFALQSAPASAQTVQYYPWCSQSPENNAECSFISEQQCLATIAGNGGYCEPNPALTNVPPIATDRQGRPSRNG